MPLTLTQIRTLIDLLGETGATAGLEKANITVGELRKLASDIDVKLPPKSPKKDVVFLIISKANHRIDLSVTELLSMDSKDLLKYFDEKRPGKAELLSILDKLDFHPGSEAQKNLYKYAARQISETGMFQRVASNEHIEDSDTDH